MVDVLRALQSQHIIETDNYKPEAFPVLFYNCHWFWSHALVMSWLRVSGFHFL